MVMDTRSFLRGRNYHAARSSCLYAMARLTDSRCSFVSTRAVDNCSSFGFIGFFCLSVSFACKFATQNVPPRDNFCIVLQYNRALRYVVARVAESTTGVNPGEGVEILVNEPFGPDNEHGMPDGGVHTEKVLRFRSRLPPLLRRIMPASATEIHESSWFSNGKGSRCKTIYRNPFLGNRFFLSIESNHIAGIDTEENAVNLCQRDLNAREVIYLDIAGNLPRKLPTEDPSTYVSEKTGRGKLQPRWWKAVRDTSTLDGSPSVSTISKDTDDGMGYGISSNKNDCTLDNNNDTLSETSKQHFQQDENELQSSTNLIGGVDKDVLENQASMNASRDMSVISEISVDSKTAISRDPSSVASARSDVKTNDCGTRDFSTDPITVCTDEQSTMTCYKVVKIEFTGFGMRRFVQRWVTRAVIPNGFLDIHRKLFCWMDDWCDLTLAEIEDLETQTAENVRARFREHENIGHSCAEDVGADDPYEYEYM